MNDFDNIHTPTRVTLSQFKRHHPKRNVRTVERNNVEYIRPGRWSATATLRCGGFAADWQKVTITLFTRTERQAEQLGRTIENLTN